jgi:hypothetical protein
MSQDMTPGEVVPTNTEAPAVEDNPTLASGPDPAPEQEPDPEPEPALPPLTPQEFRIYNRLAEQMEYFVLAHTPCPPSHP